ncbi:MAG: hypothetical protein Q9207_007506, partial [Kuettlingeria erythrocarpa]
MGLVGYSDSDGSDIEEKPKARTPTKTAPTANKPAFQKVVDRSDPHKIRVQLPESVKESEEANEVDDEPPAKKARTDGGAFSGFNSFLPAPKRTANGVSNGLGSRRGGLGSGVSLKTGAAPGFSREPIAPCQYLEEESADAAAGSDSIGENQHPTLNTTTKKTNHLDFPDPRPPEAPQEETKKKGNAMMFKPLSVARKPQKKKATTATGEPPPAPTKNTPSVQPKPVPK